MQPDVAPIEVSIDRLRLLALQPDIVKLDRGLVGWQDADVAEAEATTLAALGVRFAQGCHFGRPAAVSDWAQPGPAYAHRPGGGARSR